MFPYRIVLSHLVTRDWKCFTCSDSFSERQRKWKEELDEELKRNRGKFTFAAYDLNLNFSLFYVSVGPTDLEDHSCGQLSN